MSNELKPGRLRYIEPTNIFNESKNVYGEDIPFPYEDYCMSVDLIVRIVNRYSCGWPKESGREEELIYSSSNGSLSFLGGSKISDNLPNGYLTTNFTDISMINPGENTSECLGIESISISYTNWMHPEVNIKFIDVRGATVMQPSENGFYSKNEMGLSRKLYKALFTFPYPMFELKVKGFYGKGVTYKLAVSKSDIEFDSESGNFVITVSLIGFMYGIYADLPMTFISCAPYIPGGREYWQNQINNGTFMFKDSAGQPSQPMVTIPELRMKVAKAAKNEEAFSAASTGEQKINSIDDQCMALKNLMDFYPLKGWWTTGSTPYFYNIFYSDKEIASFQNKVSTFFTQLEDYKKAYTVDYSKSFEGLKYIKDVDINLFKISYIKTPIFEEDNAYNSIYPNNEDDVTKVEKVITPYDGVLDYINTTYNKNQNYFYVCFINKSGVLNYDKFTEVINSELDLLNERKKTIDLEYKTKKMSIIENVLGFRPSIRNIYELIFAHMETFMYCFYSQTAKIAEQIKTNHEYRLKKTYNIKPGMTDTVDETSSSENLMPFNKFLPPYTGFYKEVSTNINSKNGSNSTSRKELAWPEDVDVRLSNLEEVKFVQHLINGSELYYENSKKADSYLDSLKTNYTPEGQAPSAFIGGFIPLTTYDFVHKDIMGNPYTIIRNKIDANQNLEGDILGLFALRAFYYTATNLDDNDNDANAFGILEALNLYKAIGDSVSENFFNFVMKYADGAKNTEVNNFLQIITGIKDTEASKIWKFGDNSRLFIGFDKLFYSLHEVEKPMLPLGEFDFINIKNHYIKNEDLRKNPAFISTIKPNVDVEDSSESFVLYEDRNYINNIISNIENEVNNSIQFMKTHKGEEISIDYNQYGKLLKKNRTLRRYKDNFDLDIDTVYFSNIVFDEKNRFVDGNRLKKLIINEPETLKSDNYFIRNPLKNVLNYGESYYGLDNVMSFYNDLPIELKAYIFINSLAWNLQANIPSENKNGLELKSVLLREGACYWYYKNYNNIKGFGDFIKPEKEHLFNGDFKKNGNYTKWNYPKNCTSSRRNKLIKYFENWANNDFSRLDNLLKDSSYYINNSFKKGLDRDLKIDTKIEIQNLLKSLYFDVVTIFDLYSDVSYQGDKMFTKANYLKSAFKGFITELKRIYKNAINKINDSSDYSNFIRQIVTENKVANPFKNSDLYLSTYITLKSLYDKWLCAPPESPLNLWKLDRVGDTPNKKSDFNNFIYTDSFYHDIGYLLPVNITKVSEWLDSCLPTADKVSDEGVMGYHGKSVYNFLSEVAQDCGGMLLAVPQRFGAYDKEKIRDTFTAFPLYGDWMTDESSFIFMYTYKPSEHLGDFDTKNEDMNGYSIEGDGVNLTDENLMGTLLGDSGYTVPAFGVTFAKQNQSFFKNIRLSTKDAGVTEASLAATFNIASKAADGPRETMLYGQDLYRIYSQYSYRCSAEMMGNAQIMPLMYFQLNNVPLWKGGYMILKVNHEITAGDFRTTFEGVRINRNSIPFVDGVAITIKDTGEHDTGTKDEALNTNNEINVNTTMDNTKPNHNVIISTDFNENNVSEIKPIICITPAHGPKTWKKLEWEWSSKVVDKMNEILRNETYKDGTPYNVQRCNKNGTNTGEAGYSMRETTNIIKKFGSSNVISVVPHWNGGGGQRYEIYLNYDGEVRSDSMKLAECMKNAVQRFLDEEKDGLGTCGVESGCSCAFNDVIDIKTLPRSNSDGGPRQNCACILTENWFADYDCFENKSGLSKWEVGKLDGLFCQWLFNDDLVEKIAQMHANAIKQYIDSLS